ncbi:hypothetical protein VPNG_06336 [Cytospora leucostoma]|uniref:DNA (cytosine-5-)-methyltransferase n=1 Tax=Cytospora leucostoma TaxID=1230097 RepID=A0A423X214_9PEZI|nr:hypothetical protein VPNG_06336 [Cytospora leucostoma]
MDNLGLDKMDFVISDLDPSLSHDLHIAIGLAETAELEAELQEVALDSDSEVADLQRFQHREAVPSQAQSRTQSISVELPLSTLQCPVSVFEGDQECPISISKERVAVQSLLEADPTQKDGDFIEFELADFTCYINTDRFPFEMRALHTHATLTGKTLFYFDGVLRVGDVQHHVRRVPFEQIPLGNYGNGHPTVGDQLWVRSKLNEKREIYYQLKNPSKVYARFHELFLWIADLAKHVVDFFEHMIDQQNRDVSLHHFKRDFSQWLWKTHGKAEEFQHWYKQRGGDDFRQSIVANQAFIRKEAFAMLRQKWRRLVVFREIAKPFDFYKRQFHTAERGQEKTSVRTGPPDTIVTPYIRDCFSNMNLGQLLKAVEPCMSTEERIKASWPERRSSPSTQNPGTFANWDAMIESIKPGDLVSTHHDPDDCNIWKTPKPKGAPKKEPTEGDGEVRRWYCLVQKVFTKKNGSRTFDILWMYQPEDTPCGSMRYLYKNELFLSDHCTCHSDDANIKDREVTGVHSVEWHGNPETNAEFFVRQTYQHLQRRFVTLEQAHLRCRIGEKQPREYHVRDTVLVLTPGTKVLEPYELLGYLEGGETVRLRRLLRRRHIDRQQRGAPNELVYTEEETYASINGIHSKCIIRCYSPGEEIPVPYNLNGTGNAFIITHRKLADGSVEPLGIDKPQIRQGFDPKRPAKQLRGLDLYCGCGNLGRGLEEGGAVIAKWANDIWDTAVHTYMANAKDPRSVTPFLGSVDDLLHLALEAKFSNTVPRPGEVDVTTGGSPCPGFSLITADKTTIEQKKNRSLVASFAAYVDFYRPKYGLLENVTSIIQRQGSQEDFLSQLFCAIVGMGYQAQVILGDSWTHGSPQRRERAFLLFAAPGLRFPSAPKHSHSHPSRIILKGLGKITNGEPFMKRIDPPTAFKHTTPLEATSDLPDIYDAKPDTCVPFPDHRLSISVSSGNMKSRAERGEGKSMRTQLLNIPIRPYGMDFSKAWYGKTDEIPRDMFDHERDAFPMKGSSHRASKISQGWGRVHPNGLFATVTTFCHITDARTGHWTHWDQPRPLTIMEVRRAQGIPDDEVLLGTPKDQWKLVGNAVARQMATALGLALREAWMGTLFEEGDGEAPVVEEEEEEAVNGYGLGNGSSRSQTPGFRMYSDHETASAQAGGISSTPATSLPDVNDDFMALDGAADSKKRSLSKALADELLASKRLRLTEPGPELQVGSEQSSGDSGDDDDLLYLGSAPTAIPSRSRWDGPTVVSLDDEVVSDEAQHQVFGDEDVTSPGPDSPVDASQRSGPTIVRLLSDDEDEDAFH